MYVGCARSHLKTTSDASYIVFPIFGKAGASDKTPTNSTFSWLSPLGPGKTCLHGTNLSPSPTSKVAAFDLDGCVIRSSFGAGSKAKGAAKEKGKSEGSLFEWWRPTVPKKLKEVHDDG